jgi:hypothetical protein
MNGKYHSLTEAFTVSSICREDLTHPVIGFTVEQACRVSDEDMRLIAKKLSNNFSNQILKGSIKIVVSTVINEK